MEINEITDNFINGNISQSCEQIEEYGMFNYFDQLRFEPCDHKFYIRVSIAFIFYMENKDN